MQKTYTAAHQAKIKTFATCLREWDGYTQTNSKVGSCLRQTATEFESACIAKLFKFSCFGAVYTDSNSGRFLGIFPTFEFICVYETSFRDLKAKARSMAAIPVTVISRDPEKPIRPGMSEEALQKGREELEKLKKQHLEESPHARFIIAGGSGHLVQIDRPDVVIDEIRRMIDCVNKFTSLAAN